MSLCLSLDCYPLPIDLKKKIFIEFVTVSFLFYVLGVFLARRHVDLSFLTRDRMCTPCIET